MRRLLVVLTLALIGCSGHRASIHNDHGVTLDKAGKYAEAAHEFGEAVRLDPETAKYHYNLGLVFARMRHYDQASHEFTEALRIEPGHVDASRALSLTNARIQARALP